MPKKQLSGSQKRRLAKARALAGAVIVPRPATTKELESLTGLARVGARDRRRWEEGRITNDQYLTACQGLRVLSSILQATEHERQRQIDERLAAGIEALEMRRSGLATITYPATSEALNGGEFMPRETVDDGGLA